MKNLNKEPIWNVQRHLSIRSSSELDQMVAPIGMGLTIVQADRTTSGNSSLMGPFNGWFCKAYLWFDETNRYGFGNFKKVVK